MMMASSTSSPVERAALLLLLSVAACTSTGSTADAGTSEDAGAPVVADLQAQSNVGRAIAALAWRPATMEVAVGQSGALDIRELSGAIVRGFAVAAGQVSAAAFNVDGTTLATGGQNNPLKVWDATNSEAIATLSDTVFPIRAVSYSPSGLLAASLSNNTIKVFQGTTPTTINQQATTLTFQDDNALVVGSADGMIRRYGPTSGIMVGSFQAHSGGVTAVAVDPAVGIASVGGDRKMRLSRINGDVVKEWDLPGDPTCVTLTGQKVVAGTYDGTVAVGNAENGVFGTFTASSTPVRAVVSQGSTVVMGMEDGTLAVWTLR
ncbi:MAG: hypothetical protein AB2A00_26145 [Myxococcota bacterium]